jgi:hypothetical protein
MITELPRRIERLLTGPRLLERSRELLDPCRARKVEGCLLWYGYVLDQQTCLVTTCVRPAQRSYARTYEIPADSMRDVRQRVRVHRLLLIVQIHSHPAKAFFSTWDEQHALNKQVGAFNMVVPDYGNVPWIDIEQFCMVEQIEGHWRRWTRQDWDRLVIVPDALGLGCGYG